VKDAFSARHVHHLLVEISETRRGAVAHEAHDLERHVAVADNL
jgi:hypothetical protein